MAPKKSLLRKWNTLRKSWIFQVSAAVLLGLGLLGIILWSQLRPQSQPHPQQVPAFTIGNTTVSALTMNYYFRDSYDSVLSAMKEMSDDVQLIDPSVPLDRQQYSEAGTWADVLFETALSNASRTEAICAEALAQDYDFDSKAVAKAQIETLQDRARQQGFSSLTAFLQSFYGPDATVASYEAYLERTALADSYSHSIFDQSQDQAVWDTWFQERIESQSLELASSARDSLYYAP